MDNHMEIKLIEQIVKKVFPKEATLVWNAKEVSLEDRFWIISSSKGSRWLIPQASIYGLPVLSQWQPYGTLSQVKWRFLLAAYGTQQLHHLPGITPIGVLRSRTGDWNHLGGHQNQAFIPVIYIGTPGSTRKAVVSLTDVQQQVVVSVAKIPLEESATVNILREAETLASLTLAKPGVAPKPLLVNQDLGIAVQSAIPGRLVEKRLTKAHIQWLDRLSIPDQITSASASKQAASKN
jgi:hypothetical protein